MFDTAQAANDPGLLPLASLTGTAPAQSDSPDQITLCQLRHHSKNALQRLLWQVSSCQDLQANPAGRALVLELERRIVLSAAISDALFGFVQAPLPLQQRLQALAEAAVDLMSDPGQVIAVKVGVDGDVPDALASLFVRVAHELVGNAVKHGMHIRLVGEVEIRVRAGQGLITMMVSDDGWGMGDSLRRGEGLRIAQHLAAQHGGNLSLAREAGRTVATLRIPRPALEKRA